MRRTLVQLAALFLLFSLTIAATAQTTITGNVRNSSNKDVVPAVSVTIKGSTTGTFTDEKGNFRLITTQSPPFTLVFTSIGYELQEVNVSSAGAPVQVDFIPASSLGIEVVVSASRVPERILESPVSIERVSAANIRVAPATSYYDIFRNIKGVDVTTSSMTFNTVSTRGFNGSGSARVNQLVDGMDNQAPGLNFSVGNVIGVTELDVESMELLPGASSALYGPGGMNGTVLINSKNPFRYQGLSYQVKTGIMHVDGQRRPMSPYYDFNFRWGHKVSEKFAFKVGMQLIQAKDWMANDTSNYQIGITALNQYGDVKPGTRASDPGYDGVNVYGDETFTNIKPIIPLVAGALRPQLPAQLQPLLDQQVALLTSNGTIPTNVSRTGYLESDVVNNNTVNAKVSGGLYYRLTENIEASLVGFWGTGNTVYQGADRYSLRDLKIGQYKLEVKHKNWFARAYTTQENAGSSYAATVTTGIYNESWKGSPTWFQEYVLALLQSKVGVLPGQTPGTPADDYNAHLLARGFADIGRPAPGSAQFNTLFDKVRSTPIKKFGGLFLDRSDMYMVEGQYNFSDKLKVVDLLIGGNWRRYVLQSEGTLFADTAGNISINELGGYIQIGKAFMNDKIKLTASGRYDKNDNFDGRFTPRFTAVYKITENHNFRASYQTAYRFPTTQNQYINLTVAGGTILLGGLPGLRDIYNFKGNPPYTIESVLTAGAALQQGVPPAQALALLKVAQFEPYVPETMKSGEIGYKGLFGKKVLVDVYGYLGKYENFLGRKIVMQAESATPPPAGPGQAISVAVNSKGDVKTYGFGGSIDWLLPRNFNITVNASTDKISGVDSGFISFFNSPSYRLNVGFGNSGFGYQKRFGFNVVVRNQDGFYYESDFRQGYMDGFTVIDAQVSYKFPAIRSILKLGGTNISNKYYKTAFANPEIGGIYYLSFGYNVF